MRYFVGLIVLGVIVGLAAGFAGVHFINARQTYVGPPVAGFTTGTASCSPICGHPR